MLKEGTMAPDFTLPDQNGQNRSLKDYRGQRVILYFYPKDLTAGCTAPLLSDPELSVIKAYDVLGEKKSFGKVTMGVVRTTYLIDANGVIEKALDKVKASENPAQMLKAIE